MEVVDDELAMHKRASEALTLLVGSLLCPLLAAVLRLLSSALPPVGLLRRNVSLSHVVRVPFRGSRGSYRSAPLAVDLPVPTPPVLSRSFPPPPPSAPKSL